jgi:hypothetical protein
MSDTHHIYELFDPSKFVAAFELDGKDVTVTIERVVGETIEGEANRKARKPVIHFKDWPKPLVLNKTNAKVLIHLYGADYRKWTGKRFTMYPTTAKMAGDEVDAIRLRKKVPPSAATVAQSAPPRTEMSLPERTEAAMLKLAEKNTEAGVSGVWKAAEELRVTLQAERPDLLVTLTAAKDERLRVLREGSHG